jgi:hypothetical protein
MSKEQKESNNEKQKFWQMVIETWQSSGLSVSKFCEAEGLSEGSFYNWRKKLTVANSKHSKQNGSGSSAFIEVSMPKNNPVALELVLSSGNSLRISSGADNKTLSSVLSVLREAGLC